jgi:hypothetical protein
MERPDKLAGDFLQSDRDGEEGSSVEIPFKQPCFPVAPTSVEATWDYLVIV